MALKMKIPTIGGGNVANGYVMVSQVTFGKALNDVEYAIVDMVCFTGKTERDKGVSAQRTPSTQLDKRKYPKPATIGGDPIAWAYDQLKADSTMTDIGAMTDV
tara:strand:+ start:1061 stop:1369 length:309 start_codon:yes stop_codon:yes gene_type:complete